MRKMAICSIYRLNTLEYTAQLYYNLFVLGVIVSYFCVRKIDIQPEVRIKTKTNQTKITILTVASLQMVHLITC